MVHATSGIIVAGGQSRRFGSPKAFALKDGIPFYQFSIDVMKPFTESIVLVSNSELINHFSMNDATIKLITDLPEYKGLGPLAGIYSGMEAIDAEWYLISPIDVPFMEEKVFSTLLQHVEVGIEAIVPIVKGRMQPLISIFHQSMKAKIKMQLDQNELSPKQLFAKSRVRYIDIFQDKAFRNINFQEDLRRYLQDKEV